MNGRKKKTYRLALPLGLVIALFSGIAWADSPTQDAHNASVEKAAKSGSVVDLLNATDRAEVKRLKAITKRGNIARAKLHRKIRYLDREMERARKKGDLLRVVELQKRRFGYENNEFKAYRKTLKEGRRAYKEMLKILAKVDPSIQLDDRGRALPATHSPAEKVAKGDTSTVGRIAFAQNDTGLDVSVRVDGPLAYSIYDKDAQRRQIVIRKAMLSEDLNKRFETASLNTSLKTLDAYVRGTDVVLDARGESIADLSSLRIEDGTLTWHFRRLHAGEAPLSSSDGMMASAEPAHVRHDAVPAATRPTTRKTAPAVRPMHFSQDRRAAMQRSASDSRTRAGTNIAQDYGTRATLKGTTFSKQRITLDVRDVEIQDLLRLISDEINVSIVTSPEVKGTVTLSLKSVPLDQALDIILRMNDLGMKYEGKVIWVAKSQVFRDEQKRALEAAMVREKLEPLEVRLIPVNYATAEELKDNVAALLSERGSLQIDARTNTLIIKDVSANLDAAEILVDNLDTQTPQILIEARIVETQANFTKEIGVQWGGDGIMSSATGNATGIAFPSSIGIAGASTGDNNGGTSATPNFAVNLPAAVGTGSGGALGMSFGSIGGAININLRLSALEKKGFVKIVSAPRVMTLDNIEASIEQGTSIPISVVSAAGAQTVFFDAKLNLKVTPHVTRDANVFLKIDVTKNEPDFSNTGASGDPSIIRKEAHTQLLVPDGNTTVIGGIYTRNTAQNVSSVPFLGSIPFLGYLFRNTSETDNRTELLIFITPRIINREHSLAKSGAGSFIPPSREAK